MKTKEIALLPNGHTTPQVFVTALPSIDDLYQEIAIGEDTANTLNVLLDKPPAQSWVKQHPFVKKEIAVEGGAKIKVGIDYLPIGRVEWLLKRVFKRFRIEILREGTSFNGVYVVVRIHSWHPISQTWEFHDGMGAQQLQTAAGKSAADLGNIINGALNMAFPIAKSLAIKDACDHFGRLFGSDLNRNETAALPDIPRLTREESRIVNMIQVCTSKDQLEALKDHVTPNVEPYYTEKYDSFV